MIVDVVSRGDVSGHDIRLSLDLPSAPHYEDVFSIGDALYKVEMVKWVVAEDLATNLLVLVRRIT